MLWIYLIFINFVAFFMYWLDKEKAKRKKWRIKESQLIGVAVIGGSLGALLGMILCHHKTKHKKFTVTIPVLLAIWSIIAYNYLMAG